MRLIKWMVTLVIAGAAAVTLITGCPTREEFAAYYTSRNETGLGGFFDGAAQAAAQQRTEVKDYLFFAVFEIDGERYVGVLGHFFGGDGGK